jgi:enoyl-CoA hydratase/carnithine racemase
MRESDMPDEIITEFKVTYADSRAGRVAVVTMDNGHDYTKPNTFGEGALHSLNAALDELSGQSDVKGLLLTGKQFIFAVGADLNSFEGATPELALEGGRRGHAAFRRIAALPFPTLAAINGACMGGGLEIALHCDYRTLSSAAAALAFPEVFLSILPGWGGTQLTPGLIGGEKALQVIVHNALSNNTVLKPQQAFELGLQHGVVAPSRCSRRSSPARRPSTVQCPPPTGSTTPWPTPGGSPTTRCTAPRARRTWPSTASSTPPGVAISTTATSPRRRRSPSCCRHGRRRPPSTPSTSPSSGCAGSRGSPTRSRGPSASSVSSAPD